MKRPGPVGLLVLLAFAIPVIIELRTILSMFGIDLPYSVFVGAVVVLLAAIVLAIFWLPEDDEGNPNEPPRREPAD